MRKCITLVLSLLLVACADEPTTPFDGADPQLNWMNNPDNGNPRITRFEGAFIVCWTDPDTGLRACHSTVPLGGGTEPDCGPQAMLDPLDRQEVGLIDPDNFFASWLHVNQSGDAWITVRDLTTPGTCFGRRLVAEGWGRAYYRDNDLFGIAPGDRNANTWAFGAQGRLTTPTGQVVTYNGHSRFVFTNAQGFRAFEPKAEVH